VHLLDFADRPALRELTPVIAPAGRQLFASKFAGVVLARRDQMKGIAICIVAFGLLAATAAPSLAGNWYPGGYVPAHYRHHFYPAPVIVAPAPVYGYAYPAYAPVVAPYPAIAPAPGPYYYGAPAIGFGYRGRGVAIGVGL
jgi:hypothetical protein